MKRRTFLKYAAAVPIVGIPASTEAVIGEIEARTIVCVNYPPGPGKALVLLELASRICERHSANVVLWGADGSVVEVGRRLARRVGVQGVDSGKWSQVAAYELAVRMRRKSLLGYSLLALGDWSTFIDHARPFQRPATRFIPQRVQSELWAAGLRLASHAGRG